jgi:multiple sugar transport system substrate-binding protein
VPDNGPDATVPQRGGRRRRRPTGRSRFRAALVLTAGALLLTGCRGDAAGPPTLTWYINPDTGGTLVAARCTDEAKGAYRIKASLLPSQSTSQREQLVRRLAAKDHALDLLSLDTPYVAEFAEARFLHEIPTDLGRDLVRDTVESAVRSATWKGRLVASPFYANTQLLWYRKSVVRRAGLDPERATWDDLVRAARQTNTTVGVQANRYEGYTVWINALVASAGGKIIDNPEADVNDLRFGLDSGAGTRAAQIIREVADVGGPGMPTADEEASRALFQSERGGFLVNWPYVWSAVNKAVDGGALSAAVRDDIGWTLYPRVDAGTETAPPSGGTDVAIGAFTRHPDLALAALRCITSPESQKRYMLEVGNPAANTTIYDDPEIRERFPTADAIRRSLKLAVVRPQTPFYGDVSEALQRTFHPPRSVDPQRTPQRATRLIQGVLEKRVLL